MKELFRRLAEKAAQLVLGLSDCPPHHRRVGVDGTLLQLLRHLAAFHQHRNDDRYFLDGLPYPKHPKPRDKNCRPEA